jgi:ATP-dependent protease HslVU (ClpYQ) peptidase subunit
LTTLAAFQGNGWAVIGCDSRASDESGRVMNLATPKIVQNGAYLIAVSGASRGGNIAQFGWTPPAPPDASTNVNNLDKFMTRRFIPALREAFIEAGYDAKPEGDSATQDSPLIVVVNGIIYPISEDYSWDREVRSIYCGGSGGDVALGAMVALGIEKLFDEPEKASRIVRRSVEVACMWDAFSNQPIVVKTQHGKKTRSRAK